MEIIKTKEEIPGAPELERDVITIKAETWTEALLQIVLILRDEYATGDALAGVWICGLLDMMRIAEARGMEASALSAFALLLSPETDPEDAGIYLAAIAEAALITEEDFRAVFELDS